MTSSPADPTSPYSKTARLACWLTGGGTRRPPSTALSLLKMARERNAVRKAEVEWTRRKKAVLAVHVEQWGNTGLMGLMEEVAAVGPRPRGTALSRWSKELGEGRRGESASDPGRRNTGNRPATTETAGQQVTDVGPARAEDAESATADGDHHVEFQRDSTLAAHEDEVDAGSDRDLGTSISGAARGEDSANS